MASDVIIGSLSGLAGVTLGSWLSARTQLSLQNAASRDQNRQARRLAAVEFLTAFRQFRRFLQTEDLTVRLIPIADRPGGTAPVIEGAGEQWKEPESNGRPSNVPDQAWQ